VKLCLAKAGESPRIFSRPLPYDDRARYRRHEDIATGVRAALDEALGAGAARRVPEIWVAVTSAGYAYPTFPEGIVHAGRVLSSAMPGSEGFFLSATLDLVPQQDTTSGDPSLLGPICFSNPNGGAWLARRFGLVHPEGSTLCLDTGGQTTGTLVLTPDRVDPAALAEPARHIAHRMQHGKLCWIGVETTPLEALAHEVPVDGVLMPVVPRGVMFENVAVALGMLPEERVRKLTLFGLLPDRAMALRALADALGLDPLLLEEPALLGLAQFFRDAAVARLALALRKALATAPVADPIHAVVFGIGAVPLAVPALLAAGIPRQHIVAGSAVLGAPLAEAASCFGPCHAGLERLAGVSIPLP
jgi:hypothetical protein